jgi:hypothetical protein
MSNGVAKRKSLRRGTGGGVAAVVGELELELLLSDFTRSLLLETFSEGFIGLSIEKVVVSVEGLVFISSE